MHDRILSIDEEYIKLNAQKPAYRHEISPYKKFLHTIALNLRTPSCEILYRFGILQEEFTRWNERSRPIQILNVI